MLKRVEHLSFIIGMFFLSLSVILGVGYMLSEALHEDINLYAALLFLAFGSFMVWVKSGEE